MAETARQKQGRFTYADYVTWDDGQRWELIEGAAFAMTPAPSARHQRVLLDLATVLNTLLRRSPCQVFCAPFDVRLSREPSAADTAVTTVVQPDIAVICDPSLIDEAGCSGPPDLVVEILSASTALRDQTAKLLLYEKHRVREYWIVDPELEQVLVYSTDDEEPGRFGKPHEYRRTDTLRCRAVPAVAVLLAEVFGGTRP